MMKLKILSRGKIGYFSVKESLATLTMDIQDISNAVNSSKLKCHERLAFKLNDPRTAPKNLLEDTKNIC